MGPRLWIATWYHALETSLWLAGKPFQRACAGAVLWVSGSAARPAGSCSAAGAHPSQHSPPHSLHRRVQHRQQQSIWCDKITFNWFSLLIVKFPVTVFICRLDTNSSVLSKFNKIKFFSKMFQFALETPCPENMQPWSFIRTVSRDGFGGFGPYCSKL
jgi:hypothetical protein